MVKITLARRTKFAVVIHPRQPARWTFDAGVGLVHQPARLWHVERDADLSTEGNRVLGELLAPVVEDLLRKRNSPASGAAK